MALTQLDPNAALIVIDLQKGIASMETARPSSEIIERSARLARAFRERGLPVVLVNVAGTAPGRSDEGPGGSRTFPAEFTDLVPELDAQPTDHRVTKHAWGAFTNTDLDSYLRSHNVTQVFFAGIATSVGVESTARSAHELGYNVVFVTDAMTDRNPAAHQNSLTVHFPRLGETTTTDEALKFLQSPG